MFLRFRAPGGSEGSVLRENAYPRFSCASGPRANKQHIFSKTRDSKATSFLTPKAPAGRQGTKNPKKQQNLLGAFLPYSVFLRFRTTGGSERRNNVYPSFFCARLVASCPSANL